MPEIITTIGAPPIVEWSIRLLIDLITVFVLARLIYYPLHRRKEYLFTFFLFNAIIFFLCLLLSAARLQVGFAFGLFAVFSMIRYRTVTIPVREMGYFFVCVALGLINALASANPFFLLQVISDCIILLLVVVLDKYISRNGEQVMEMTYERMDLITPEKRTLLIADLKERTGLMVQRIEIVTIDFLQDVAVMQVYYREI